MEEHSGAAEHSDVEDKDADAEMADATKLDDEDIDADAEIAASTEHSDGEDVDANADMPGATEHAEDARHEEDDPRDPVPVAASMEQGADEDGAVDPKETPPQIFQLTISLRDDWLHRGDALQDMDLQTYAEFIERRAKPIRGADIKKALAHPTFAFDAHYKLAPGFMQVLRPGHCRCVARFNVPNWGSRVWGSRV